jgi:hypothetical protein
LDSCYYVGHLGEAEIPHLNSVEFFSFNELSHIKVFKDLDEYGARFTFAGEEFMIRSTYSELFDLFENIKKEN